jgi:hypothetical protein
MTSGADEREILAELAERVRDASQSRENLERRQLWLDTNGLRKATRAPVFLELYDTWPEVLPASSLVSSDPLAREIEYGLRQTLYKLDLGDDDVVEPWIDVPAVTNLGKNRGVSLWGIDLGKVQSASGAWLYAEHPIRGMDDLAKLAAPRLQYDAAATENRRARVEELVGGVLPARVTLGNTFRQWAKLHAWAAAFCGLQELYVLMIEQPAFVHELMRFLRDGILRLMDEVEAAGILRRNNTGRLSCDDLPAPALEEHGVPFRHLWGRGESQEIDGVSPLMFEEFLFQYQLPILSRFGVVNYGCCENLTDKIGIVLGLPNLRQFICSAWTSVEEVARQVGDRCAIEWRGKATDVIAAAGRQALRKPLEDGLRVLAGCHVQIMLDSIMTTHGNPGRLREWVEAAKEASAKFC